MEKENSKGFRLAVNDKQPGKVKKREQKRYLTTLVLVLLCVCFCVKAEANELSSKDRQDIQTIKKRLYKYSMNNPNAETIKKHMSSIKPDGSWDDIDYTDKSKSGWQPANHIREKLLPMAKAYTHPENHLYHKAELKKCILLAFDFWVNNDFSSSNYWWNAIGIPKEIGPFVLLMENALTEEQIELALYKMDYESRYKKWKKMDSVKYLYGKSEATGQNKLWLIKVHLFAGLIRKDIEEVRECLTSAGEEFNLQHCSKNGGYNEGVQVDYSFHQHGPQLYSGGYGSAFAIDASYFAALAHDTQFQFDSDKIDTISGYILDGQQWMTYKGLFEYSAMGRSITRKGIGDDGYASLWACEYMLEMNTPRHDEFRNFAAQLKKKQGQTLEGNKHFWCSDFMVHRDRESYFSVKMNSTRTLGTESGNDEGLKNYYLSDGCTYIFLEGNEYNNIFPVWDWCRIPGVTCQYTQDVPELEPWGKIDGESLMARGNTDFVGGVSDGICGLAVMDYDKDGVKCRKGWFCFDEEIVCLGAGIACNSDNPVITSVNQCILDSVVISSEKEQVPNGKHILEGPSWVYHDGVGYAFPDGARIHLENNTKSGSWWSINHQYTEETISKEVFSLWIDHGIRPDNQVYSYIVVPGVDAAEMKFYAKDKIDILSNTPQLQAVRNRKLQLTQIAFYEPGKIDVDPDTSIGVDKPCLLMLRKGRASKVQIAVANPENLQLDVNVNINIRLTGEDVVWDQERGVSVVKVQLPAGDYAGQTVIKEF